MLALPCCVGGHSRMLLTGIRIFRKNLDSDQEHAGMTVVPSHIHRLPDASNPIPPVDIQGSPLPAANGAHVHMDEPVVPSHSANIQLFCGLGDILQTDPIQGDVCSHPPDVVAFSRHGMVFPS